MSVIPESDREQEDIADSSIRKITDRQEYPDMSGVRVSWERLSSDRHRLELMLARINPITPPGVQSITANRLWNPLTQPLLFRIDTPLF